ncbi:hypothetical protein LTSEINV_5726 [Salmonella enterica subsp. enterica serovar Inverness str. R8-3668]|uniref:Uncharacterized protein n=1 Tax=Salmonella enterica subsp. enterica serovar Inverness str. R8-3668 TaxID=913075 RepID=G5NKQ2_SALET|nr:hypothetical protein LTSEINV_5726 [Salmonella enterica subsp. enterica serovar Inverness str. R8-3668]
MSFATSSWWSRAWGAVFLVVPRLGRAWGAGVKPLVAERRMMSCD